MFFNNLIIKYNKYLFMQCLHVFFYLFEEILKYKTKPKHYLKKELLMIMKM